MHQNIQMSKVIAANHAFPLSYTGTCNTTVAGRVAIFACVRWKYHTSTTIKHINDLSVVHSHLIIDI